MFSIQREFFFCNYIMSASLNFGWAEPTKKSSRSFIKLVKKQMDKSFSDKDILKLCQRKVKILTYPELHEFKTIEEALEPHGSIALLYLTKKNYGHWVCINEMVDGSIEFFDSYGFPVDKELDFIGKKFKSSNDENYPYLSALLLDAQERGKDIIYNEHKLQELEEDSSTCGRWICMRIILKYLMLEDFVSIFRNTKFKPDFLVTALTLFV